MSRLGSLSKLSLWAMVYPSLIAVAFSQIAVVFAAPPPVAAAKKAKPYRPKIFKPHEFKTLKLLTETILRDDEMPGVREAKANEFIDFQITFDPEIQDRFRDGLLWLDRHSLKLHGKKFIALKPAQRKDIIQCLETKALHRPGEEPGRKFYELVRRYTYMGFYASEEALRIAIPAAPKESPKSAKQRRLAGAAEDQDPPKN